MSKKPFIQYIYNCTFCTAKMHEIMRDYWTNMKISNRHTYKNTNLLHTYTHTHSKIYVFSIYFCSIKTEKNFAYNFSFLFTLYLMNYKICFVNGKCFFSLVLLGDFFLIIKYYSSEHTQTFYTYKMQKFNDFHARHMNN